MAELVVLREAAGRLELVAWQAVEALAARLEAVAWVATAARAVQAARSVTTRQ